MSLLNVLACGFDRDLVSTRSACHLNREFPEYILLGQAKLSINNSQFELFRVITKKEIPNKPSIRTYMPF